MQQVMNRHELPMFLFINGYPYLPVSAMGPVPFPSSRSQHYLNKLSAVMLHFRVVGDSAPTWKYMVEKWSTPLSIGD